MITYAKRLFCFVATMAALIMLDVIIGPMIGREPLEYYEAIAITTASLWICNIGDNLK